VAGKHEHHGGTGCGAGDKGPGNHLASPFVAPSYAPCSTVAPVASGAGVFQLFAAVTTT
jgi:hypothetical protein